jgi:hypothetical protein
MHECELYLDQRRDSAYEGAPPKPERDCIGEFGVLAALYFRELKNEADRFISSCRSSMVLISELRHAVMISSGDPAARQAAWDNFHSQWNYREFGAAQKALTAAARSLLERIMNVDEGAAPSDER